MTATRLTQAAQTLRLGSPIVAEPLRAPLAEWLEQAAEALAEWRHDDEDGLAQAFYPAMRVARAIERGVA